MVEERSARLDERSVSLNQRSATAVERSSASLGIQVSSAAVREVADFEKAIRSFSEDSGLVILTGPLVVANRDKLIELVNRYRLPSIYPFRQFAVSGGLASYGVDNVDLYRRAGSYIDRVLKGANPAELPVQQAIKFQFVVNRSAAQQIGIELQALVLARADEVIE